MQHNYADQYICQHLDITHICRLCISQYTAKMITEDGPVSMVKRSRMETNYLVKAVYAKDTVHCTV